MKSCPESSATILRLSKNTYTCGKRLYKRQRRGVRITWIDELASVMEQLPVSEELGTQLEAAYQREEDNRHKELFAKLRARRITRRNKEQ